MKINYQLLKQLKLIFNISVNRNGKKLTVSRKMAKILTVSRKSHHPIETLYQILYETGPPQICRGRTGLNKNNLALKYKTRARDSHRLVTLYLHTSLPDVVQRPLRVVVGSRNQPQLLVFIVTPSK